MADIHIRRQHQLGMERAREAGRTWTADAEKTLGLQCVYAEGERMDCVEFRLPGVKGSMDVTPDYFELRVELGFLFKGFRNKIVETIEARLDDFLATR